MGCSNGFGMGVYVCNGGFWMGFQETFEPFSIEFLKGVQRGLKSFLEGGFPVVSMGFRRVVDFFFKGDVVGRVKVLPFLVL